ncbi:MAG: UDP-N-acetylglucosamine 1-carboxyvinyltransferase [Clostridia bacterium]|nr:UDP-N-acetylglucosamine 1-carboxyvinyltransferase [Clostridia bacterium]
MNKIVVNGGRRLSGEVVIGGSKNAALPLLFGGIATGEVCIFSNLPRVSDVLQTLEILKFLGARIRFLPGGDVRVDYSAVQSGRAPVALTASIRGSTYLLGSMLARFGRAELAAAGGCDFGSRPIDQHLMGFECLGAKVSSNADGVVVEAPNGLCGTVIRLAMPSVGATANLMIAASMARGETVIENAAAEPHVAALAAFLCDAGAEITGVGSDRIRIVGQPELHGTRNVIIPDMIEAGTYLCAGVACGGPVRVRAVCPSHLHPLLNAFREMGVKVETGEHHVTVTAAEPYQNISVVTGPFPAFPTDLHPQMTALFALGGRAEGEGAVTELVWESRFRYTQELCRMGARIDIADRCARITPQALHAAKLRSPDLRGGAALLLAALATKGKSEITNAATIGRGYEHLEQKLRALGAHISVS